MIDASMKAFSALMFISCIGVSYIEWVKLAIAFKSAGGTLSDWLTWCATDLARYDEKAAREVYENPDVASVPNGSDVTALTLWKWARDCGWRDPDYHGETTVKSGGEATESREEPLKLAPAEQTVKQLETLFAPNESVCIVTEARYDDKRGKWHPVGGKCYNVGKLVESLNREGLAALGNINFQAGVWLCANPTNGKGRKDADIAAFRHVLVESDDMPTDRQLDYLLNSGLPISTITMSGGKSVHALVRVDADSPQNYADRVNEVFRACKMDGITIDTANRNAGRLTRLAGVPRGDEEQTLLYANVGASSFSEWRNRQEELADAERPHMRELPPIFPLDLNNRPPLKPEQIGGLLRQGHKMMIASSSKAGKTWTLDQLALCVASGKKWLDWFECKQGKVLYADFELDTASLIDRFGKIADRMNIGMDTIRGNLDVWSLRGHAASLGELVPSFLKAAKSNDYALIVIDPIYKVQDGDENSAQDVRELVVQLDKICQFGDASVVFTHHFAKGASGGKSSIDRASGSGVFGRDPDAILTMTKLDTWDIDPNSLAMRIEMNLREFPEPKRFDVFSDAPFPYYVADRDGIFSECGYDNPSARGARKANEKRQKEKQENITNLEQWSATLINGGEVVYLKDAATHFSVSDQTIRNWVKESEHLDKGKEGKKNIITMKREQG